MALSGMYGAVDRNESIATIHAALDAGITLLDTGDFYDMGLNELLLRDALQQRPRDSYLLSVKFGEQRDPGGGWHGPIARPKDVKNFLAYSLNRLGTEYIDIYRPGRLDPEVPVEETVGAIADMVKAGYVRYIGLSEVGVETLHRATAVHPIVDLQIEYSLMSRGIEDRIMGACRELGVGITAYAVIARGLLSGSWSVNRSLQGDSRGRMPRFSPENLAHNLQLVDNLRELAETRGVSAAQLAIAWVLSRGEYIVPLTGARRPTQLAEALGALEISLTPEDLDQIETAVPNNAAAGLRYPPHSQAFLDSEKS